MPIKVPVLLIQSICIPLLAGLLHTGMALAESQNSDHGSTVSIKKTPPVVSHETGPKWTELSPNQQHILQPLQNLWPSLEENRKRKWLAIAKNFPTLSPQAQATAQERMREWAALTPSQRYQARLHFTQSQQLSNDEKLAKWEEYQSLNEEEKHKLNQPKPVLPKGAAMVPRPVSPAKLTTTPVIKKEGQDKPPRIETAEVDPFTLLPIKKRVSSNKQ